MSSSIFLASLACLAALTAPILSSAADTPATGVPINRRLLAQQRAFLPVPYDSHPAFALDAAGKGFAVWHSYAAGEEWIVGRTLPATREAPMIDIAGARGVMSPPEVAASSDGSHGVTWAAFRDGRWQVMARRGKGTDWSAPVAMSDTNVDALHPAIAATGADSFAVAWVEFRNGRFAVVSAALAAQPHEVATISAPDTDAFRPMMVKDGAGACWIFWDAYRDGNSAVHARRLSPQLGSIERVSTSSDRCLKPVALVGPGDDLYAAWVKVTDVIGGEGVIDQLHSIELARRRAGRWELLTDSTGRSEAALLAHGLLAMVEPRQGPTGGYLGRRRDPLLVRDGNDIWLLWERKASRIHEGNERERIAETARRS